MVFTPVPSTIFLALSSELIATLKLCSPFVVRYFSRTCRTFPFYVVFWIL